MNILVAGCGRVGASLANELSSLGHDVSVIDPNPKLFHNLSQEFSGITITGNPIDQDVLLSAGIEGCDALAAVMPDDNVNIMVAQLAQEIFKVKNVIARITDPKREDIFSQFGLQTICPTNLAVKSLCSVFLENTAAKDMKTVQLGISTIQFCYREVTKKQVGKRLRDLPPMEDGMVLYGAQKHLGGVMLLHSSQHYLLSTMDKLIYSRVID